MGKGSGLGGFIIGGIVGALGGILYAPRSGSETRNLVSEKVDEYWGQGQQMYSRGVERVSETVEAIRPVVSEKNDELRDKIDDARERIAEQVAKNAGLAHDIVTEKVPVAAEKVEKAVDAAREGAASVAERISPKREEGFVAEAPADEAYFAGEAPAGVAVEVETSVNDASAPDAKTGTTV